MIVSESASIVDFMEAFDELTMLIESPQEHTMNEPSDDTTTGPPP